MSEGMERGACLVGVNLYLLLAALEPWAAAAVAPVGVVVATAYRWRYRLGQA